MKINFLNQSLKWKDLLKTGFETQRLVIRTLEQTDLAAISNISGGSGVFTFVEDVNNSDEAVSWVQSVWQKRSYLLFSIRQKTERSPEAAALIGVLMLNNHVAGNIEIGGFIDTRFQGKGFGTEVVQGLVGRVRKQGGSLQLFAEVQEENSSALKVLRRTGVKQKINPRRKTNDRDLSGSG